MCANWLCAGRIRLGWVHDAIFFAYHMFMHSHAYVLFFQYILIYLNCFGTFLGVSFFPSPSPHSLVYVSASWHPSVSQLRPRTLCVLRHRLLLILLLLIFGSVIRMPERTSRRTFLDEVYIWNVESFWRTSPTLTFPLSFTIGDGSHCVTSRSPVHSCWSKSFTPTCMDLII